MTSLSNKNLELLRKMAHLLDPSVQIGKNGLTENVITAINNALEAHELIKLKYYDEEIERQDLAQEIVSKTQSELVQSIGHTISIFRRNNDPKKRKVSLI